MHTQDAPDFLILQVPLALHEQLVQRTEPWQDTDKLAAEFLVAGFDNFESRVLFESPSRVIEEYTDCLTRWASPEVVGLTLPLTRSTTLRMRFINKEYEMGIPRFALMCIARGMQLNPS